MCIKGFLYMYYMCMNYVCKKYGNMEKIQERALRFVYEDYESRYHILLKKGNHDMLYIDHLRNMATEIFKALHGSTPIYIRDLFEEKDNIYNLQSTLSLKQPKCNTVTYGLESFWYKDAKILNDLPNKIKNYITLAEFKTQIKKWQGPKCICNMCTRLLQNAVNLKLTNIYFHLWSCSISQWCSKIHKYDIEFIVIGYRI